MDAVDGVVGRCGFTHTHLRFHAQTHEKPQSFVHPSRTLDAVQETADSNSFTTSCSLNCRARSNGVIPEQEGGLGHFPNGFFHREIHDRKHSCTIFPPDLVPATRAPRRLAIAATPTPRGPRPRAFFVLDVERGARGHQQLRGVQVAVEGSDMKGRGTWEAREAPRPKKPRGESSADRSLARAISGQRGPTKRSRSFVQ